MVIYFVMKRTTTCSPIVGQCFDTMIVASSDKEWLYNDNNPSKSKCWKLFWATLDVERTSESWRKVEATALGSSLQKIRVESRERRCNDSTFSFWKACLFLSSPTCFSPTYQLKSFRPNLSVNKRKSSCHFAWRNGSIAAWMFVYSTNTAVIMDLKVFLISQKLFLSTSECHCYYQGWKWNMPDFWNFWKFIGSFWSFRVLFY